MGSLRDDEKKILGEETLTRCGYAPGRSRYEATEGRDNGGGGDLTFGERDDVVVLIAETAMAVPEALADDVTRGILAPPLGVAAAHHICLLPALSLGLGIEESGPLFLLLILVPGPRRGRTHRNPDPPGAGGGGERGA